MLTDQQAGMIFRQALEKFTAKIRLGQSNASQEVQSMTLDLSTEKGRKNALKVPFPFTSCFVEQADDIGVYVNVLPETNNDGTSSVRLSLKDSLVFEHGASGCYLYWPAQPGKTIILKFLITGKFQSGSLIVNQANTPAKVDCGYASADLDGFTREVGFSWAFSAGLSECYDFKDSSYNTGALDINGGGSLGGLFQCPTGYTAEVIGADISVNTLPDQLGELNLTALTDDDVYIDDDVGITNRIGRIFAANTYPSAAGTYDVRPVSSQYPSGTKGLDRKGAILTAGEVLTINMATLSFALLTQGIISGVLLIRLKPVVGA